LLVTDYFVQTGQIGIVNTPADFKAQWIDILPDGSLSQFPERGGAWPHSAVIFDLTDPKKPYYY
jgi:hypothetical protein